MKDNPYDRIYNKLQEPLKIYLSKETKELLEIDYRNSEIDNKNLFYNLLITNYIDEYTRRLEETSSRILHQMNDLILAGNKNEFPVIARKLAFGSFNTKESNEKDAYISIRINTAGTHRIAAAICNIADNVKVSVFFRDLFLNYLTLPSYRREQIIFLEQYTTIMKAIKEKRKISYRHRKKKESRVFNLYSVELSSIEFHNYLIGCFDGMNGASSIKLITLESVRILNESVSYNDTFKECYKAMKQNGFQFNMNELKYHKVYLNDQDMERYKGRYLDRPIIIDEREDDKGKYYIFNCSRFQLNGYFSPFRNDIEIVECEEDK